MKKVLLATVAMLALSSPAWADQFQYTSESVFQGQNVTITSPTSITADAGMIQLTGSRNGGPQTILDAWCVDLFDTLQGSGIYNIVPLTTAGAGGLNPSLTATQINVMGTLMLRGVADTPGDLLGPDSSTAFQIAIWREEFQGSLIDNASPAIQALVATMITNASSGGIWFDPNASVDLLDAPAQNQVLAFGVDVPSAVPLPAALPMFLGSLGVLGFVELVSVKDLASCLPPSGRVR